MFYRPGLLDGLGRPPRAGCGLLVCSGFAARDCGRSPARSKGVSRSNPFPAPPRRNRGSRVRGSSGARLAPRNRPGDAMGPILACSLPLGSTFSSSLSWKLFSASESRGFAGRTAVWRERAAEPGELLVRELLPTPTGTRWPGRRVARECDPLAELLDQLPDVRVALHLLSRQMRTAANRAPAPPVEFGGAPPPEPAAENSSFGGDTADRAAAAGLRDQRGPQVADRRLPIRPIVLLARRRPGPVHRPITAQPKRRSRSFRRIHPPKTVERSLPGNRKRRR